jgi:hypothetical protein
MRRRSQVSIVLHGPFLLILSEHHLVQFTIQTRSRVAEDNNYEREHNLSELHRTLC